MKFSFLGIDVVIKKQHVKDLLSLNDINYINNELLSYLKNLNADEINKRIQDVTCTVGQGVKKIKETLSNKGIIIIPDFIPENSINKISQVTR